MSDNFVYVLKSEFNTFGSFLKCDPPNTKEILSSRQHDPSKIGFEALNYVSAPISFLWMDEDAIV
uniref:Uncharacterized protein n=1 Tax=Cannabis sativa TaxID=3483 RepID=A0A803R7Q9_CANSA